MTIFRYVKVPSGVPDREASLGGCPGTPRIAKDPTLPVNPPPRKKPPFLETVTRSETQGKGCSIVWNWGHRIQGNPHHLHRFRHVGFTEMQSWKDNYDLRCVHSSKNAVKHSQTRGPKDTIKSNMDDVYRLRHVETQRSFSTAKVLELVEMKTTERSLSRQTWSPWWPVAICCHLLPSVAICCHLLPSVAICCHLLTSVAIGWTTVEDLNMNCLGSKLWVSQLHSQLTISLVAPVERNGSVGSVRHTVSQSWPSSRMNHIAWKKQPTVECNLAKVIQHRLVHTANQLPSATLITFSCHQDTLVTGDGFWNISCETTTRLRRCFNQTPMSASVASHMWRNKKQTFNPCCCSHPPYFGAVAWLAKWFTCPTMSKHNHVANLCFKRCSVRTFTGLTKTKLI